MKNKAFNIAEYLANYGFRKTDSIETEGDVYVKAFYLMVVITDKYIHILKLRSLTKGWELRGSCEIPTNNAETYDLGYAIERLS